MSFIENTWFLSVEATIAKFGVSDNEHMQCWAPPEPQMKTTALEKWNTKHVSYAKTHMDMSLR